MKQLIKIEGMTCSSCKSTVEQHLKKLPEIKDVSINLERKEVTIYSKLKISEEQIKSVLPKKYSLIDDSDKIEAPDVEKDNVFKKLKPLFLILFYISTASVLMNRNYLDYKEIMLDYMGLFFIVFSFFKILDLNGFSDSFRMYDPIAKNTKSYGRLYPFLETLLGVLLLMRIQVQVSLVTTIIILGATTIGVASVLSNKRKIRCACLGTVLDLPMTQATLIENTIMLVMSVIMLFSNF